MRFDNGHSLFSIGGCRLVVDRGHVVLLVIGEIRVQVIVKLCVCKFLRRMSSNF